MNIKEKTNEFLSRFLRGKERPPLEKYYAILLALFIGYAIADLGVLYSRRYMLPTDVAPVKPPKPFEQKQSVITQYKAITERNIFNEDGLIPPALSSDKPGEEGTSGMDRPAVLTALPIELKGTIVHFNPKMSIATVELKSKSITASYRVDEEIDGMALVTLVERKKVTFLNLNNRRLEYAEIKDDDLFKLGLSEPLKGSEGGGLVEQKGVFDFAMKRSDLEAQLSNLGALLQQARAEPVYAPDGIGVEGYRLVRIQPGSIYEKLGFKAGDIIRSANGEPVTSPQKAMEMLSLLKNSTFVQLGVERDGREEKFNYSVQ